MGALIACLFWARSEVLLYISEQYASVLQVTEHREKRGLENWRTEEKGRDNLCKVEAEVQKSEHDTPLGLTRRGCT